MIRVQNSWEVSSRTRQELRGVLTMPIDSQSPWQNGKTERAGQSFKHQLWDLDEECHIEGETESEAAVAECCDARNRYCNRSGFSAHQRVFGSSLRLPGSLLSDDPIDRQLLTADPYTNFHRANEMRTAAQRALFKHNSARAVPAAGLARHRPQPREKINAGDTTMVWRNNKLTGRKVGLDQVLLLQCHQREHRSGSPCVDAF